MIIVKLMGGLGNQMFQYAAARRLAHHHNTELKLDLTFLKGSQPGCTPRSYELSPFHIQAAIASSREVAEITGRGKNRLESGLMRLRHATGLTTLTRNVYSESHFNFDPVVLDLPDNIYLDGYWQSERYFKDIDAILRKELVVRHPLESENSKLAEEILSVNSVSLHVRRGDYLDDPATKLYHGTCGTAYYEKCVARIAEQVKDPHFYIFSDDHTLGRERVTSSFPMTIINHNGLVTCYEDIRLMSLCKHNIIANSTFSWWGAWLNSHHEKIVLAPRKWFNRANIDTRDLLPEKWVKISE